MFLYSFVYLVVASSSSGVIKLPPANWLFLLVFVDYFKLCIDYVAIAAVREAINRNDTEAMKRTYDDLQNKFQEVSAELYKQASAGAGAQAGPPPEAEPRPSAEQGAGARGGNGDVVDAEFEVVDEDKKK